VWNILHATTKKGTTATYADVGMRCTAEKQTGRRAGRQRADQLWPQSVCDAGTEVLLAVPPGTTLGWSKGLADGVGDGGGVLVKLVDGIGLPVEDAEAVVGAVLGEEDAAFGAAELGVVVGEGVLAVVVGEGVLAGVDGEGVLAGVDGEADVAAGLGVHGWLTEGVALRLGVEGPEVALLTGGGFETCDAAGRTFG
jgi:hypothetical protein